jgi:transcriptional regulator with XRE-family HTH domain
MTKVKNLHRGWMKNPKYKTEYAALEKEFQLARTLIEARTRAGLSQTQLARRMKTSQSYVARIESGQVKPSTAALERLAKATGSRLKISFRTGARRLMANRNLTAAELEHANRLLADIRQRLSTLAGDDPVLLFAYRRKISKESRL